MSHIIQIILVLLLLNICLTLCVVKTSHYMYSDGDKHISTKNTHISAKRASLNHRSASDIVLVDSKGDLYTLPLKNIKDNINELHNKITALRNESDNKITALRNESDNKITALKNYSNTTFPTKNHINATFETKHASTTSDNSLRNWVKKNYVAYDQELGLQGLFGCGQMPKHSVWLSTYKGPFRAHSDTDDFHQNTRWYIRKRCGGCSAQYCGNGKKCFKSNPPSNRHNSNVACPY